MVDTTFKSFLISIILLVNCCSAKVQLITEVIGADVDLNNYLKCSGDWKEISGDQVVKMPIKINDMRLVDTFECQENKDQIIIVRYEKMYFISGPPVGVIENDNVSLDCYSSYTNASFTIDSSLTIADKDSKIIVKGEITEVRELERIYATAEGMVNLMESGRYPYNCAWDITVNYKGEIIKITMLRNVTVRVNKPVTNAKPDKQQAKVEEKIFCVAEGDPPPINFEWRCSTGDGDDYDYEIEDEGWLYNDNMLQLLYPWKFICKCVASSEIDGRIYHSVWNGTIVATTEDGKTEERKKKTKKEKMKVKNPTTKMLRGEISSADQISGYSFGTAVFILSFFF